MGGACTSHAPCFRCALFGAKVHGVLNLLIISEIENGEMANEPSYKYLPRPDNASSMSPSDARALFRRNGYYGPTAGFCLGHAQTNVAIMPKEFSEDFEEFCKRNSGPLPLLYRSGAGEIGAPPLATDSNVR